MYNNLFWAIAFRFKKSAFFAIVALRILIFKYPIAEPRIGFNGNGAGLTTHFLQFLITPHPWLALQTCTIIFICCLKDPCIKRYLIHVDKSKKKKKIRKVQWYIFIIYLQNLVYWYDLRFKCNTRTLCTVGFLVTKLRVFCHYLLTQSYLKLSYKYGDCCNRMQWKRCQTDVFCFRGFIALHRPSSLKTHNLFIRIPKN